MPPGVSADQTVCILCDEEAKQLLQMLGGNPNANNFTNRQGDEPQMSVLNKKIKSCHAVAHQCPPHTQV